MSDFAAWTLLEQGGAQEARGAVAGAPKAARDAGARARRGQAGAHQELSVGVLVGAAPRAARPAAPTATAAADDAHLPADRRPQQQGRQDGGRHPLRHHRLNTPKPNYAPQRTLHTR